MGHTETNPGPCPTRRNYAPLTRGRFPQTDVNNSTISTFPASLRCTIRKLAAQRNDFCSLGLRAEIGQGLTQLRERGVEPVPVDVLAKIEARADVKGLVRQSRARVAPVVQRIAMDQDVGRNGLLRIVVVCTSKDEIVEGLRVRTVVPDALLLDARFFDGAALAILIAVRCNFGRCGLSAVANDNFVTHAAHGD